MDLLCRPTRSCRVDSSRRLIWTRRRRGQRTHLEPGLSTLRSRASLRARDAGWEGVDLHRGTGPATRSRSLRRPPRGAHPAHPHHSSLHVAALTRARLQPWGEVPQRTADPIHPAVVRILTEAVLAHVLRGVSDPDQAWTHVSSLARSGTRGVGIARRRKGLTRAGAQRQRGPLRIERPR